MIVISYTSRGEGRSNCMGRFIVNRMMSWGRGGVDRLGSVATKCEIVWIKKINDIYSKFCTTSRENYLVSGLAEEPWWLSCEELGERSPSHNRSSSVQICPWRSCRSNRRRCLGKATTTGMLYVGARGNWRRRVGCRRRVPSSWHFQRSTIRLLTPGKTGAGSQRRRGTCERCGPILRWLLGAECVWNRWLQRYRTRWTAFDPAGNMKTWSGGRGLRDHFVHRCRLRWPSSRYTSTAWRAPAGCGVEIVDLSVVGSSFLVQASGAVLGRCELGRADCPSRGQQ